MELLRQIIATILVGSGLFVLGVATLGIFRFDYALNRSHVAAKCDTMGALLVFGGLALISGLSITTLKIALAIIFIWIANPVASHLIAGTEIATNPDVEKKCEVIHK